MIASLPAKLSGHVVDLGAGWGVLAHAALATAISAADAARFGTAAIILVLGAILFSGTLYVMALGGPRWLGAVTPIGGLGLLAGWALIAAAAIRS